MAYKLLWQKAAQDDLARLDKTAASRIIAKATGHLVINPISFGAPLKGNFAGLRRYRVGSYRLIYSADEQEKTIKILAVGHRKDIYE